MSLVKIDLPEDRVARLTLDQPERRHALSAELRTALMDALEEVLGDPDIRAIVITGSEGHFCAGGDISSMKDLSADAGRARMQAGHRLVRLLAYAEKPLIAAVEGYAMGAGAGIALWCDTVIAGVGAHVGFPFFRIGLVPDYGITYTLPRRIGEGRARRILLNAKTLSAQEALDQGLFDEVVPEGGVQDRAIEAAAEMARQPATAVALTKQLLNRSPGELEALLQREALSQGLCMVSDDHKEGASAFREKREPNFR
ncbi:MAG: enoyl-CoA hydratase/isomerase family protein [Rhodospirillales bacterium]|nr:enoyl-CoA hydratase/isomerase family protein [Rhodospirillales bacterium]